jgi:hypothetical protein
VTYDWQDRFSRSGRDGCVIKKTIRFSDTLERLADEDARREGLSFTDYVREAVAMRVALSAGRRGDRELERVENLITRRMRR